VKYDLEFNRLSDSTDHRGYSYSLTPKELAVLTTIQDVHIAAIRPGQIRGNHYHLKKCELITVVYDGPVSVHWDTGEGTSPRSRTFDGSGAVSFAPPFGWSHAVRNDGDSVVWIVVASDKPYDRAAIDDATPNAIRRVVTD
jgi:oxalate decarboxylase/phosphoglucose isomerase-like protein (cupin superfamily)